MLTDEEFFAWLDGELDAGEAARVEAEVRSDPELAARVAEHRAMQARLGGAFAAVLDAPVPEQLQAAAWQAPAVVADFTVARKLRQARVWRPAAQWAAIAATLAIGVLLGTMVPSGQQGDPVKLEGGRMYAASAVNAALDSALASAPGSAVRIGITFRDHAGQVCRTFTAEAASGLACRSDGRWQLRGLFSVPEGQGGDYRMAAGMDPNLAALVDSAMAGEPFDAAQEKAAKDKGWR